MNQKTLAQHLSNGFCNNGTIDDWDEMVLDWCEHHTREECETFVKEVGQCIDFINEQLGPDYYSPGSKFVKEGMEYIIEEFTKKLN